MANDFSNLLGQIASPFYEGRPLDEEERRRIEELRAQGAYVPQERKVSPFGYGSGRQRREDLAAIRSAIKPEQTRRMSELMFQRGEAARNAAAVEKFNREQGFANQLIQQNRARQVADEEARQRLGGLPTTTPRQRFAADQAQGTGPSMMYRSAADYAKDATPQMTDRQRAEHAVLQREITPSLTQAEALKQAQQKTVTGQIDVETKRRADDLAKQVHSYLPSDYAKSVADSQVLGLELKTLLDTQRLAVSRQYGKQLLESEADASLAAKKQEIRAIEALETWLGTPEGIEFLRLGGPQREAQRMKLTALRIQLMEAENRQTSLRGSNWWDRPNSSGGSSGGGGSSSGWNPNRTFNWDGTNAPPVNPRRRFP
jgi:hypothetical protein